MKQSNLLWAGLLLAVSSGAWAQALPAPESGLSIERLMSYPIINGRSPAAPSMAPDGSKIAFGWNQTGARMLDLWVMDYPSGNKRRILASDSIARMPMQDDDRTELQKMEEVEYDGGIGGIQWSPDSREIMAGPYRGRVWLMNPDGSNLRPMFDSSEGVGAPQYSPDGKWILFMRGSNLFRLDRKTGSIKQLTFLNRGGQGIDGYVISPDSGSIAVSWSDQNAVGSHYMMDFTKDRAEVVPISRNWDGEMSQNMQVGFVPIDGGKVSFIEGLPRYMWMTGWDWSPDSRRLAIAWISDDFQKFTVTLGRRDYTTRSNIYEEKAPSNYIPDFRTLFFSRDGKVNFTTDIIDGKWAHRSLMSIDQNGQNLKPVYAEDHDIAAAGRPKDSDRIILVTQKHSQLRTEITIQEPDGKRTEHVVMPDGASTPVEFDAAGLPLFSDDGKKIATLASNRTLNNELYAVEPAPKRLTESQLPEFKKITWADYQEVEFAGPDGKTIKALMITKKGLDKSKKHPAFISNMYANSAKRSWAGYVENYAAVELGFVVLQVDFRASWGQGGEFNSGYYKKMGIIDVQEAVKAKDFLVNTGYVNPDRVGVWGWSYGGYLTCMIMLTAPGVFDTGVAVASVTDWSSYNEWYTRRRLGLPSEDDAVYKATSPVYHAKGLAGNFLMIHGMLDDNVLFQDTVRLQENLIKEGKYFDEFDYPRGDHGMWRVHERPHVFANIMRYLYAKLYRD
jgi:dipeptidyl-peptidase-4